MAVIPRELPPDVACFTGRTGELAALTRALDQADETPRTAPLSVISGMPGVGKTALAVHWARQVAERFPDGQLYANLRGFGPSGAPVTPAAVIRGFLDSLGVSAGRIPPGPPAQLRLLRELLARQRLLIVLDNARDVRQVRPLLPGTPGCPVIVTSRRQLGGLASAESSCALTLDSFSPAEARQMLTARLGASRAAADPAAVAEITGLCAQLPLALAVAAARAAARPGFPLSALAAELRGAGGRLDGLSISDQMTDMRAVFSWSLRQLSPAAENLFGLLGLHPGPDVTAVAAASLAGIEPVAAAGQLRELTDAHLLTERAPGRYAFHDLVREFAVGRARATHGPAGCHRATARLLDHYLHTADAAARWIQPYVTPESLPPAGPGVRPEPMTGPDQATAWLAAERPVLLTAVGLAARTGFSAHAWQLPWALSRFLARQARWNELAAAHTTALEAASRVADPAGQASACRGLGLARLRMGEAADSLALLHQALSLHRDLGDPFGRALIHVNIAMALVALDDRPRALGDTRRALVLFQQAGHRAGQAVALNITGWIRAQLGDYDLALAFSRQALAIWDELSDRSDPAAAWDSVGYAHSQLGQYDRAISSYQRALGLTRQLQEPETQARVLVHLGDAHRAADDPRLAGDAWREALDILDSLHHPDADDVRARFAAAGLTSPAAPSLPASSSLPAPASLPASAPLLAPASLPAPAPLLAPASLPASRRTPPASPE